MAQQIKEMDQELEQYHKSNAALDLMIGELRLKMEGMQVELDEQKVKLKEAGEIIASFSTDLHALYQDIEKPKRLKVGITKLYKKMYKIVIFSKQTVVLEARKENLEAQLLNRNLTGSESI